MEGRMEFNKKTIWRLQKEKLAEYLIEREGSTEESLERDYKHYQEMLFKKIEQKPETFIEVYEFPTVKCCCYFAVCFLLDGFEVSWHQIDKNDWYRMIVSWGK